MDRKQKITLANDISDEYKHELMTRKVPANIKSGNDRESRDTVIEPNNIIV